MPDVSQLTVTLTIKESLLYRFLTFRPILNLFCRLLPEKRLIRLLLNSLKYYINGRRNRCLIG